MITTPLIITWVVGSAVGATAGYWVTRAWKKITHENRQIKAEVASLTARLDHPPQTNRTKGQSL